MFPPVSASAPLELVLNIISDAEFCCSRSEVVADDTPAVQAVLKADTRRLKLLDEERKLQNLLDKGEDGVSERLEKVGYRFGMFIPSILFMVSADKSN